jgi:hypothetical protein
MGKSPDIPEPKTQAQSVPVGGVRSSLPSGLGQLPPQSSFQNAVTPPSKSQQIIGGSMPRNRYDMNTVMQMLKSGQNV